MGEKGDALRRLCTNAFGSRSEGQRRAKPEKDITAAHNNKKWTHTAQKRKEKEGNNRKRRLKETVSTTT